VADHLCHSAIQAGLKAEEAVDQLAAVVAELSEPIEVDEGRKIAVAAILSVTQDEIPLVETVALADGPHFMAMDGSWSIKPVKTSDNEVVLVPIVSLGISWHDQNGTRHAGFFQMSESEWESFRDEVDAISDIRQEIDQYLRNYTYLSTESTEDR